MKACALTSVVSVCAMLSMSISAPAAAATYELVFSPISAINQTFSGLGYLGLSAPAANPVEIDFLEFSIFTQGSIDASPVMHRFDYTGADVFEVRSTLTPSGHGLAGIVALSTKQALSGAVIMGDYLVLDFTNGISEGFCFQAVGLSECIIGGGTSTSIEAHLSSTLEVPPPVPLPAALPLFLSALGLFGFIGWRKRLRALAV